jgi:hypothetical protein
MTCRLKVQDPYDVIAAARDIATFSHLPDLTARFKFPEKISQELALFLGDVEFTCQFRLVHRLVVAAVEKFLQAFAQPGFIAAAVAGALLGFWFGRSHGIK